MTNNFLRGILPIMKIQRVIEQHKQDFIAIYKCENCNEMEERGGYDIRYFHQEIIPSLKCKKCGKKRPEDISVREELNEL